MLNHDNLRTALRRLISPAAADYPVVAEIEKRGSDRFVLFSLQDMPELDGRLQMELEIDVVGPMSDSIAAETVADEITGELDCSDSVCDDFAFYIYKNTRNRVDGSDPHTVRYRMTFDLYLYERN